MSAHILAAARFRSTAIRAQPILEILGPMFFSASRVCADGVQIRKVVKRTELLVLVGPADCDGSVRLQYGCDAVGSRSEDWRRQDPRPHAGPSSPAQRATRQRA